MHQSDAKSVSSAFGERIRDARKARDNMSQRALAEAVAKFGLQLDPSAITRIERGERSVKVDEAVAIAAALETTVGFLLGEESQDAYSLAQIWRHSANAAMPSARSSLADYLSHVADIKFALTEYPELIPAMHYGDEVETPDDYLTWVLGRVRTIMADSFRFVAVQSEEDLERIAEIGQAVFEGMIEVDPEYFEILRSTMTPPQIPEPRDFDDEDDDEGDDGQD